MIDDYFGQILVVKEDNGYSRVVEVKRGRLCGTQYLLKKGQELNRLYMYRKANRQEPLEESSKEKDEEEKVKGTK